MDKLLLSLLSAYLGLGTFFSFVVAPTLFRVLDKAQAGGVVERLFPIYFGIGIGITLVSLLLGFISGIGKLPYVLLVLALVILLILEFYILPVSHSLKQTDYQAFLKYHGISMAMNLALLLLVFIEVIILLRR